MTPHAALDLSYPQRLRLDYAHDLATAPEAKYAARLGYLRLLASSDPYAALAEMRSDLETRPDHTGLLVAVLDAAIETGDMEGMQAALTSVLSASNGLPFWVPRLAAVLEQGVSVQDGFEVGIDAQTTAPLILRALAQGSYEQQEARMARKLCRAGDRVLELGAGIGFIALSVAAHVDVAAYRAVEANPNLIPLIQANRARNAATFEVENAIYGKADGTETLHLDMRFWASSMLPVDRPAAKIDVPARDINAVQQTLQANVLIMDIEGAEYMIINTLDLRPIDRMIIEFHPDRVRDPRHSNALQRILRKGFVIDMEASTHKVLAFYRP